MTFSRAKSISIVLLLNCIAAFGQQPAFLDNGLYAYVDNSHPLQQVNNGDNEFASLRLDHPIHFFSDKYDQIFINSNGILTFNIEFIDYINQPFPLEYPSIAPFYTNVDTTLGDSSTSITLFESQDPEQLRKASDLVRLAFYEKSDFEATRIIVATWQNVGYFSAKNDKLNTFQAVIITNDADTFVQYIYPENGINWLRAESGSLGLPDVRAQAGFVAEDGRVFNLEGSSTENVRFLSERTNVGLRGNWLFQVGALDVTENIRIPTNMNLPQSSAPTSLTCAEAMQGYCHSQSHCVQKSSGFCCVCEDGYYGNGHECIKKTEPLRVTTSMSGEINGAVIDERTKLQSYVVMSDARSYTTINPVNMEIGTHLRLALPIFSSIGWLFAKPVQGAQNGFQLTGGVFTQISKLHFDSGEVLLVNQTFEGLNYWDQLVVKIDIFGEVPRINYGSNLHMADYIDEYKYESPSTLHSVHAHTIEVANEKRVINFQLDQFIDFERCMLDTEVNPTGTTVLQKVSKIVLDYFERDQALRASLVNKIGVDAESNSCTDGSANCGPNTVCMPYEDTYRCDCLHGYGPQVNDAGDEICVDIDECAEGVHVCDANALCANVEGGFNCICLEGFIGNGYRCLVNGTADNLEQPPTQNVDLVTVPEDPCYRCSEHAYCSNDSCICVDGYYGNGYECVQCPYGQNWVDGRCETVQLNYHEAEPHCDNSGLCICPEGFTLNHDGNICNYVEHYPTETTLEELVPCERNSECHPNATCEWWAEEARSYCKCHPGFTGDGLYCELNDESCSLKPEICGPHATCSYDDHLGRSVCTCEQGFTGDGFHCQVAAECTDDYHCGMSAHCVYGVCHCDGGYERDLENACVPVGSCGSRYCGINAICKWDAQHGIKYCDCLDEYEGDPLRECRPLPVPCNVRNNCGDHANCEPTEDPKRYNCVCEAGFQGDGYTCIELENCLNNPHLCDMNAKCSSTNSGLVCVCNEGFYGNGSVCHERQNLDSGFLLISQGIVIVRAPLNGKNVRPISVISMAVGLDKDCTEGRVYWGSISDKKIESSKYDGSDMRSFIVTDIESPEGIAIDSSSRRIYWTDSVKDVIEVASLDNPELRTTIINKNLVNPRGIAIDMYKEKLYWSDWDRESPKIEMSNLDGTEREQLLGKDVVKLPNSLVVLENTGELCFADSGTKMIQCIEPTSKQMRTVAANLTYPFGLTFLNNQFFWTDWTTKKLESADMNGHRQPSLQIPLFGSHKMFALTAVEEKCTQHFTPCTANNGGCIDNRLCLVNRLAPSGKRCKCTAYSKNCF